MDSPYRTGKSQKVTEVADGGIVDDLVRQFADKFAFLRELIQNSLDADATQIEVQVIDQDDGVRVSVRDDGCGMDPEVLQNKLLVLFQSGKENQDDKIGKFGVGFISVLAFAPEKVVVSTSTGGPLYTLELRSDHSYEVFEGPPQAATGTTVALHINAPGMTAESFGERCEQALRQWCRHATVPIHFQTVIGDDAQVRRIDASFQLDPERVLAEVSWKTKTGIGVVGIPAPGVRPRQAFFNRGLTLFETEEGLGLLSQFELKIQDTRFEHTSVATM